MRTIEVNALVPAFQGRKEGRGQASIDVLVLNDLAM